MRPTIDVPKLGAPEEVDGRTCVRLLTWDGRPRDYTDADDPRWIFHRGAFWERCYNLALNSYCYVRHDTVGFNPLELR